ncbi:IS91 family transposase, partial [Pseudomonas syringae pv. pisi]
ARLRFLVSDAMCKPVLRRDRLDFGYDNRFQNPTICSRRLPSS